MANIAQYEISCATSTRTNANTNDEVHLRVYKTNGQLLESFNLDDPNRNDRERGRTDTFPRMVTKRHGVSDIGFFILQTYGDNAWLPASFLIKTVDTEGDLDVVWFLSEWGNDWLSTDRNDANGNAVPAYRLVFDKSLRKDGNDVRPVAAYAPDEAIDETEDITPKSV